MIDEYWTFRFYGYHSDELKPRSCKPIVTRCDGCCQYKVTSPHDYHDFCPSCVRMGSRNHNFGKEVSAETRKKLSISNSGKSRPPVTDEARANMSKAGKGRVFTDEHKYKISESSKGKIITEEQRQKMSESAKNKPAITDDTRHNMSEAAKGRIATDEARANMSEAQKGRTVSTIHRHNISAGKQGIPYEEWDGYATEEQYCEKFDEACRERIRAKYYHRCFVCDTQQDENINKNGKMIKLAVHHVDMNKDQGRNGNEWKLVPLCMHCHGQSHSEPMKSRLMYLIDHE